MYMFQIFSEMWSTTVSILSVKYIYKAKIKQNYSNIWFKETKTEDNINVCHPRVWHGAISALHCERLEC